MYVYFTIVSFRTLTLKYSNAGTHWNAFFDILDELKLAEVIEKSHIAKRYVEFRFIISIFKTILPKSHLIVRLVIIRLIIRDLINFTFLPSITRILISSSASPSSDIINCTRSKLTSPLSVKKPWK
ncbi:hypothetical protein ALC57_16000 [Trachymyrmex cornetzi]|uniref:Uncharacterized protein n=1 Tax=Trachymyrmex cornetzi TaxID=471704 RepID=A0A195DHC1_9HYME|nr:hypothetical protein ALC57_16000 [Trachymyrmex cornetzi]